MEKNTKINFQQWKNIENFSSKLDKKWKFGKMEMLIGGGACQLPHEIERAVAGVSSQNTTNL